MQTGRRAKLNFHYAATFYSNNAAVHADVHALYHYLLQGRVNYKQEQKLLQVACLYVDLSSAQGDKLPLSFGIIISVIISLP
jgi:hypothetical protein